MIHHILVAGLSSRFHDRFREKVGSLQRQFKQIQFISAPLPKTSSGAYTLGYVRSLASRVANAVEAVKDEQALLIVYINHGASSAQIVDAFHPYGLLDSIDPPTGGELSFDREAEMVNRLVAEVSRQYVVFRTVIFCVQEEVVNRRNRTPLLLPVQNFRSEHLTCLLERISTGLIQFRKFDAAQNLVRQCIQEFDAQHPIIQVENDTKRAYANPAGITFKVPGADLHGSNRSDGGHHRDTCRLGARVRVGHSFHRAFHYDCSCPKNLPRKIPSCHDVFDRPGKTTHVNIAPNDFARKAG